MRCQLAARNEGYRFEAISSAEFARADYRPEWLVKRMLAKGQPAVIGGPMKCMKTSMSVDLGVSLASATPFLGHFPVYKRTRVMMISGESGPHALQSCASRVCDARGIRLDDCDLDWSFRLPRLANPLELAELQAGLKRHGAEVCVIDPLYLALLNGGEHDASAASNLYATGPLLLAVASACLDIGVTPILSHHFRHSIPPIPATPELGWLSHSGISEFARQWLLLARREHYDPDSGMHRLWLSAGGSIGHSSLHAVDIDEGRIADDFTGRIWTTTVYTPKEGCRIQAEVKDDRSSVTRMSGTKAMTPACWLHLTISISSDTASNKPRCGRNPGCPGSDLNGP